MLTLQVIMRYCYALHFPNQTPWLCIPRHHTPTCLPSQTKRIVPSLLLPTYPLPSRQFLVRLAVVFIGEAVLTLRLLLNFEECFAVRVADGAGYVTERLQPDAEDFA